MPEQADLQELVFFFFFYVVFCLSSGIEPPDAQREKDGIAALQIKERKVDHCVSYTDVLVLLFCFAFC